ncbi:hypothetical protein O0I10_011161 [Lichtheimia ornata]|uniref:Ubiquitin-like domain-containing protein n=1 Tax=Lichtheimia ornata TaxID=688661 RepID=A0AAD7XUC5_9FUNG|nr:uncharacterized protein O0I10_011161 [Lichtheimia ornata]KAJ8653213.1 hypothetical protein O0I10_011161 [Lichtheimia ornata]
MASAAEILLAPFPGETLSVPYFGYEPVSMLMDRAKNLLRSKYFIHSTAIHFNGVGIVDTKKTIDECKVYGNLITLNFMHEPAPPVGRPSPIPGEQKFYILISSGSGRLYKVAVSKSNTGEDIKWKMYQRVGIGYYSQRLIFKGQALGGRRLVDYGIEDGSMVDMMIEQRGGGSLFADVEHGHMDRVVFSDDAPEGRTVCEGMNIEVNCKCTPDYHVICMQGYGLYELDKDVLDCPLCHSENVDPVTVGFHQCEYRTHGLKSNGIQHSSDWITIDNDDYNVFDGDDQAEWDRLAIQTRPLKKGYYKEFCLVCLCPFDDDYTTPKNCKHRFHGNCISNWHGECPLCRASRL